MVPEWKGAHIIFRATINNDLRHQFYSPIFPFNSIACGKTMRDNKFTINFLFFCLYTTYPQFTMQCCVQNVQCAKKKKNFFLVFFRRQKSIVNTPCKRR